jgi:hypothetical protein
MRKLFCDSCNEEKDSLRPIGIPCHLYSLRTGAGYVDKDFNLVSGRDDEIELCNRCLNIFYTAGLKAINLIE